MTIDYVKESEIEFGFDEEELIERLVSATVKMLECPYDVSVSVSVVGLDEIHRLNNEYREIDRSTDVLS
ncbi:MAG: rRNA maturation RNAse YbeY, partial [Eubacterium sp.]|nr:rRNA maturation RNAse YbeY [Eubacterium sp.]